MQEQVGIERLTLDVKDAASAVGVSERKLRELIARGEFPVVRVGTRVLVVRTHLETWLNKQAVAV